MTQKYQQMSSQQLRDLYSVTGSLLLLDIPEGLEFGVDNIMWKIGQKFKGVKFIPFGCHIISYTLKDENNIFKINKFLYFDKSKELDSQVIIMKWSVKYSMFLQLRGSQAQGYRQGVKNYHFDSYLGPYPQQNYQFWKQNTNHVSRDVLQKLDPVQKIYKFEEEYNKIKEETQIQELKIDFDQDDVQQIEQQKEYNQQQDEQMQQPSELNDNTQKQRQGKGNKTKKKLNQKIQKAQFMTKKFQTLSDTVYYSQIPRILTNDPNHINKVNIDKTQILIEVILAEWCSQDKKTTIKKNQNQKELLNHKVKGILGQIQYSFVYFLIGEDQDSLTQWKKLINLMTFSEDLYSSKQMLKLKKQQLSQGNPTKGLLIDTFQQLALEFIVTIYNQIKQFPVDFFIDELSKNSFMENCLKRFKQYKQQTQGTVNKKIKKRLQKLFTLLQNKFNYSVQSKDQEDLDEDNPTIVQFQGNYF